MNKAHTLTRAAESCACGSAYLDTMCSIDILLINDNKQKFMTYLNSLRSALAVSLAAASLEDAFSDTSRTIDQSSEAVAVR